MLSVGERVKVSGYSSRADDYDSQIGIVKEIRLGTGYGLGFIVVTMENGTNLCFKPSQLKKIKKKKEYWVGLVRYENPKTLWFVVVALEEKPKEPLDAGGNKWIRVREIAKTSSP